MPNRRTFLARSGQFALVAAGTTSRLNAIPTTPPNASKVVLGKNPHLVIHESNPAVLETPRSMLAGTRLTDVTTLFVRNNQQPDFAATLKPVPAKSWAINIDGLVSKAISVDASELSKLDQTEVQMVLQCSGNGRSLFSLDAQTKGTQWGHGAMGNVRFAGVPLAALLKHKNITVHPEAEYVVANGKDGPVSGKEDFLHTLPAKEVLSRSFLALRMNGKPLPAIHGGPVRLVTPGVYATMHIKWLGSLQFVRDESKNHNHAVRYRVPRRSIRPGDEFSATLANSRFNWRMKTKSVVLSPAPGTQVGTGKTLIQGVAFNDGLADIETVLVSIDQGKTWQRTMLTPTAKPFGWWNWKLALSLKASPMEIWSRAIDSRGRSQPLEGSIAWNTRGYEWNGVEKVKINAVDKGAASAPQRQ
jgi:sulfite oxidase